MPSGYDEANMEAVKVPAIHGWLWLKQGYDLFRKSPLLWMVLVAIGVVGMFGLASVPVIGDPLTTLLFPMLLAGYMFGCRALEQGEDLELAHLFAGFRSHAQPLVTLGGINLVGQLLIFGAMMLTGGAALVGIIMSGKPVEDPAVVMQAFAGAGLAIMIGALLFSLLVMAMQFAPMLVIFGNMAPIPAMKVSLRAFLLNFLPLIVYGLMLLPFAILASLPMMLGWVVLLPVLVTSMYASYRDMFPPQSETAKAVEGEVIPRGE
jgi:hypothetical protein